MVSGGRGEELEIFDDDTQFAALRAGFVFPRVVLESALHEERFAFAAVFGEHFGLAAERGAVDEAGFLAILAVLGAVGAVVARPNSAMRVSLGSVLSMGSRVAWPMRVTWLNVAMLTPIRWRKLSC